MCLPSAIVEAIRGGCERSTGSACAAAGSQTAPMGRTEAIKDVWEPPVPRRQVLRSQALARISPKNHRCRPPKRLCSFLEASITADGAAPCPTTALMASLLISTGEVVRDLQGGC